MTIRTDTGEFDTESLVLVDRDPDGSVRVWLSDTIRPGVTPLTPKALESCRQMYFTGHSALQCWVQLMELEEIVVPPKALKRKPGKN